MITRQVQIKLNLPLALKEYLDSKASKFDMPTASYLKHLILKDISDMEYPVFQISERAQKKLNKALAEKKKAIRVTDVKAYFKSL